MPTPFHCKLFLRKEYHLPRTHFLFHRLDNYAAERALEQAQREERRRKEIATERLVLLHNGQMTEPLIAVIREIFRSYSDVVDDTQQDTVVKLPYTSASRLWYRTGFRHSFLDTVLTEPLGQLPFSEFLAIFKKIIEEDVAASEEEKSETQKSAFEVSISGD